MAPDADGIQKPVCVPLTEPAREEMLEFRLSVQAMENEAECIMKSFIGKMPGLVARIALIPAHLDWAASADGDEPPPREVTEDQFDRARLFVVAYAMPMAHRTYGGGPAAQGDPEARRLLQLIADRGWTTFTGRQVKRSERSGLIDASQVATALTVLEEADIIRAVPPEASPAGGRPSVCYEVNPVIRSPGKPTK